MYSTTKGNDDYEFIFKVLLLGNSNVGKSSLFLRFVDDIWNDTFVPTIGVDFKIKTFDIDEKKIKMQIWDTAGQERFKNIIASYYRGAHGILLIYDVTDKDSFKNLSNWLIEIEKNASKNVLKVLIGNKSDLEDKRVITINQGKEFADTYGLKFLETSAKKNVNVINDHLGIFGTWLVGGKQTIDSIFTYNESLKGFVLSTDALRAYVNILRKELDKATDQGQKSLINGQLQTLRKTLKDAINFDSIFNF